MPLARKTRGLIIQRKITESVPQSHGVNFYEPQENERKLVSAAMLPDKAILANHMKILQFWLRFLVPCGFVISEF